MSSTPFKLAQVMAGAPVGGAESFYMRLVESLAERPEVTQQAFVRATDDRIHRLREAGVSARFQRFGGRLDLLGLWQFRRQLREFAPDVVLAWMNRAASMTPAGDYKLVCRLGHFYNLKYYRHADYWIGNTRGICDHLVQGGMPASRVVHIANFVDEAVHAPVARADLDTPEGVPLLLAAGRLHVNKGFDVLLQALQAVPDAWLWLAGTGPEEAALKALAQQLGLAERVRFLGWRTDVTALMHTADMFVCPSRHEGLGSIVLESWAHECPLVSTRSQGPSEMIRHEEDGLMVDIDDSVGLAAAINSLLASESTRRAFAAAGLAHYRQAYSREAITSQYQDFLGSVVRN